MSEQYIPFADLVKHIEVLCTRKASGVLFIATKANRSAQIVLENGTIVFVYFYNKQGQEALELMLTIQAGRYKFQENATSPRRNKLPPTQDILQFLSQTDNTKTLAKTEPLTEAEVLPQLTDEQKSILESILAEFIGPMAAIICEDHLDSTPDITAAINTLASEIPSPLQGEKFKTQAKAKLS
ncbi:DUF4388 domain-containing protein [Desulforhopalus sp. 52FAK]